MADSRALEEFDLIVIGSGSGNTILGREWADKQVALVDDSIEFGGTCLNRGCIPTKMFVHVADVAQNALDAKRLGIEFEAPHVDWNAIRDRVFGRVDDASASSLEFRENQAPALTLVRETCGFAGDHVIETASGRRLTAPKIVIATGSRPRALSAAYAPDGRIHTSDSIMRIAALPERLLIVGGGSIAVEFAHIFASLGVSITLAIRSDEVLSSTDSLVRERMTSILGKRVALKTRTQVEQIDTDSCDEFVVTFDDGATEPFDAVLVASGREPNTDTLNAAAFFDLDSSKKIATNEFLQVLRDGEPVEGIFALGDVCAKHELKHVANHQARVVRHNLSADSADFQADTLSPVPHAIFSWPQIASFGVRADEAEDTHIVVTREYSTTAYGWALEDTTSFVRLVVDGRGVLHGAHILGEQASILIQPLVMIAQQQTPITDDYVRGMYWPHPALSEVLENALLDAAKAIRRQQREHA
ncbi:mycothione reductase [Humidisolicoccus flavus]|uniref:mycothione reductase n=1 Tax=Humidisolicoccus flavus TaxID=3111414 RepID=UPI003253C2ED